MDFEDFDLVLQDIQTFLSPPAFNYFISIMYDDKGRHDRDFSLSRSSMESGASEGKFNRKLMEAVEDLKKIPSSGKTLKSKGSKSSGSLWYPAKFRSIREKGSGPESDILCSHLPICRNIVSKVYLKETKTGNSQASSEIYEHESSEAATQGDIQVDDKLQHTSYQEIVGQIVNPDLDPGVLPTPSEKGKKIPKAPTSVKSSKKVAKKKGVRNYSHPVTNPLYKKYNPEGYVKNHEELARDFIMDFMGEFNTWLAGQEGELVQVDPEIIFKILRKDLETP